MVNNFPLPLLSFKVNFSLLTGDLALVTVITPPPKPYLTEIITVFYINIIHPTFFPEIFLSHRILGPEFPTLTPKQDYNFGTLRSFIAKHGVLLVIIAWLQKTRAPGSVHTWEFRQKTSQEYKIRQYSELSNG